MKIYPGACCLILILIKHFVSLFFFFFFFACDKYPKLTDIARVPSEEFDYKGTNTNLPSIFENVNRVFEY